MTKAYHHNMRWKMQNGRCVIKVTYVYQHAHIALNDFISQFMGAKMSLMYNLHLYLGNRACASPKSTMATNITYLNS